MRQQALFIQIASLTIKIDFRLNVRPFYRISLTRAIYRHLSQFIIRSSRNTKADWNVVIMKQKPWDVWEITKSEGKKIRYFKFFFEKIRKTYYVNYHIGFFQFLLLLKKAIEDLLYKTGKGFFIHSSACKFRNKNYIFIGKSGAGKSTIIKLFKSMGGIPLSDDSNILINRHRKIYLYQTPFIESNYKIKKENKPLILDGVFFIHKAKKNKIIPIYNKLYIFRRLTLQLFTRRKITKGQTETLFNFIHSNKFYHFYFCKSKTKFELFTQQKLFL